MTGSRSTPPVAPNYQHLVYVVDDDIDIRRALINLLESAQLPVLAFDSPRALLQHALADVPRCLVLDVMLSDSSGLDFQAELRRANIRIPIIFITGHGDIPTSVQAMKAGASEFLTKPFRDTEILKAVQAAIGRDRALREAERYLADLTNRYQALSMREREIATQVVSGSMNKKIASDLCIAQITVKVHRANVMKKMRARSLVDLVRMIDQVMNNDHGVPDASRRRALRKDGNFRDSEGSDGSAIEASFT